MDNDQSTASDFEENLDTESSGLADTSDSSGARSSASTARRTEKQVERPTGGGDRNDVELPKKMSEGRPSAEVSERALVRKPKIGDTMPIPSSLPPVSGDPNGRCPCWRQ